MKFVSVIPARKGSKGLPGKNTKLFKGKSLVSYTIEASLSSRDILKTIVSSDDDEVLEISATLGAVAHKRDARLAQDATRIEDVIADVIEAYQLSDHFDALVLLQPTSPLRSSADINNSINIFRTEKSNTLYSVCEAPHHPYKMFIKNDSITPLFGRDNLSKPRQHLPTVFMQNGAVYILNLRAFMESNRLFNEPVAYYQMELSRSVDIDTQVDFLLAETLVGCNE